MMKLAKTVLSKILWMARGTATMVGLAVMLAVVLGVGTSALAAVPGDPFKLGQLNDVGSAGTGLTSDRSGPTLDLINRNQGDFTECVIAPALGLTVQPGQPPLTVNPEAGTATNLDADKLDGLGSGQFLRSNGKAQDSDKLDGKDSTSFAGGTGGKANDSDKLDGFDQSAFLRTTGKAADSDRLDGKDSTSFAKGINGKANDADRLDGKDSAAFFSGKTYLVKKVKNGFGGGEIDSVEAVCDSGDKVLGGGGGPGDLTEDLYLGGGPILLNVDSWIVFVKDNGEPSAADAEALCADFPPLRP